MDCGYQPPAAAADGSRHSKRHSTQAASVSSKVCLFEGQTSIRGARRAQKKKREKKRKEKKKEEGSKFVDVLGFVAAAGINVHRVCSIRNIVEYSRHNAQRIRHEIHVFARASDSA
jgi:3'-phosphoadenosine 5'-phosphosulfate sulfotransferase (PAPS reductase)/FAD synthetase